SKGRFIAQPAERATAIDVISMMEMARTTNNVSLRRIDNLFGVSIRRVEGIPMINCLHCFRERLLFRNGGDCLELHSESFAIIGAFDFLSIVSSLLNSNRAAAD